MIVAWKKRIIGLDTVGIKENMYWIPIDELDKYKAYPTFFKDKLKNLKDEVEHIVTIQE